MAPEDTLEVALRLDLAVGLNDLVVIVTGVTFEPEGDTSGDAIRNDEPPIERGRPLATRGRGRAPIRAYRRTGVRRRRRTVIVASVHFRTGRIEKGV